MERKAVEYICADMSYTFKPLLELYFPHSMFLINHFHVIKYINNELNNTRIRVMRKYSNDKTSLQYRILYSQNKYETYNLDIEYTNSIEMKKMDLSFGDVTDEFDE